LLVQTDELNNAVEEISNYNTNLENIVNERILEANMLHKELDLLFYRSSHDFRGPLMSLKGLAALSKFSKDDDPAILWKNVDMITENLDQMIRKFVMISEINQFEKKDQTDLVDLDETIGEVTQLFADKLLDVDFKIEIKVEKYDSNDPRNKLLKIIFANAIENAIQYKRHNIRNVISLNVSEFVGFLEIAIYDNGFGIQESILSKVTDMYYRGNKNSKGHGLGLYVVNAAVKRLGGILNIESVIHESTLIKIRIPLV